LKKIITIRCNSTKRKEGNQVGRNIGRRGSSVTSKALRSRNRGTWYSQFPDLKLVGEAKQRVLLTPKHRN